MYCCDIEGMVVSGCFSAALIQRPAAIKSRRQKGINLTHREPAPTPFFALRNHCKSEYMKPRLSVQTETGFEYGTGGEERCVTESQFYECSNRSLKNINTSQKVLKPYIPSFFKSERLLLFSKETETTCTYYQNNKESLRNISAQISQQKLVTNHKLFSFDDNIPISQSIRCGDSVKIKQSHRGFNPQENIHFRSGIENLKGLTLADSQELVLKREDYEQSSEINGSPERERHRITLEQSIIQQFSITNNFKIIKQRGSNQHISIQKSIGMVVSLKILPIEEIESASNQITLSKVLSDSERVLRLYQSIVNQNKEYILVREYYECYLKQREIKGNVLSTIHQILEIIEQLIKRKIIHLQLYDNIVIVNDRLKVSNLEHTVSEDMTERVLAEYYKRVFGECVRRVKAQAKVRLDVEMADRIGRVIDGPGAFWEMRQRIAAIV